MAYMSIAWLGSHKTIDVPFPSSASQWHAVSQDATFRLQISPNTNHTLILCFARGRMMTRKATDTTSSSIRQEHLQKMPLQKVSSIWTINFQVLTVTFLECTPWKINVEPTNHPSRKENENDVPNLHDDSMFHVNHQGCITNYAHWN